MNAPAPPVPHASRRLVGAVVVGAVLVLGTLAWLRKRSEWDFSVHPVGNPTEQVFAARATDVVAAILAEPFFDRISTPMGRDDESLALVRHTEPALDFAAVADEDDVLLWSDHRPITRTQVYRKAGQPVPLLADFFLQVDPIDGGRTRVRVRPIYTEIITGATLGFLNPHGGAYAYERVPSTTVEEYQVLLEIGRRLGQEDMAPLVLPGPDGTSEAGRPR